MRLLRIPCYKSNGNSGNKKFSQLKEKQKSLIAEWFYIECDSFYKNSNKFPSSKIEKEGIVNLVYERI